MARIDITQLSKDISQLGGKVYNGLIKVGPSVPVTMITPGKFQGDLDTFNTAEDSFGTARMALKTASDSFTSATQNLTDWLYAARAVLVSHFGNYWTADWSAAGWVSPTTAVPVKIEDKLAVVRSLASFLRKNPDFEVKATKFTAEDATKVRDTAVTAQGTVSDAEQALKDAGLVREPARETLISDIRDVVSNLRRKLAKDDPRWLAFGLPMPSTSTTPAKATGLAAQLDAMTGGLILSCDEQPLATRFRFRGRQAGSVLPFELIGTSTVPMAKTKPFPPGTDLELIVQAVNGGSQGVASDPLFFTVPLPVATLPSSSPALDDTLAPLDAIVVGTNGHGSNGHANGSRVPARA